MVVLWSFTNWPVLVCGALPIGWFRLGVVDGHGIGVGIAQLSIKMGIDRLKSVNVTSTWFDPRTNDQEQSGRSQAESILEFG